MNPVKGLLFLLFRRFNALVVPKSRGPLHRKQWEPLSGRPSNPTRCLRMGCYYRSMTKATHEPDLFILQGNSQSSTAARLPSTINSVLNSISALHWCRHFLTLFRPGRPCQRSRVSNHKIESWYSRNLIRGKTVKPLVVFYSRTGTAKKVGAALAEALQ